MCSFKRKQAISEFLRDGPLETLWGGIFGYGGGREGIFGLFAWEYNSKIIFISMASHLASLWNGGLRASLWNGSLRQQGNGLLEWMDRAAHPSWRWLQWHCLWRRNKSLRSRTSFRCPIVRYKKVEWLWVREWRRLQSGQTPEAFLFQLFDAILFTVK